MFYNDPFNTFSTFNLMFNIMFILFICVFIFVIARGIITWNKNNHSPKLIVDAKVVAKRMHFSRHHHNNMNSTTHTQYYVTFQFESNDRLELKVSAFDYGMIVENDIGTLTFQGTRFISFERK